jgi:LAS superfamily LD-carboxypeptidase LdcB
MAKYALPIAPLRRPSNLNGKSNGKLPAGVLKKCGIGNFLLVDPASRACRALVAAAEARGFQVRATGTYRTYLQQEALFRSRYTLEVLKGRPTKRWNGETWYQLPKTAMAAVPGTSNHGWGLAVDFAEELNGTPQPESVSPKFVRWLIKNAATYGFSAELQSEPWHWRYVAGDRIPAAVLKYEGSL